jgi:hypothetical protein
MVRTWFVRLRKAHCHERHAGYLTLLLHVRDIDQSHAFYALLGFETVDIDKTNGITVWARMHCTSGAIMFVPAEEEIRAHGGSLGLPVHG